MTNSALDALTSLIIDCSYAESSLSMTSHSRHVFYFWSLIAGANDSDVVDVDGSITQRQ